MRQVETVDSAVFAQGGRARGRRAGLVMLGLSLVLGGCGGGSGGSGSGGGGGATPAAVASIAVSPATASIAMGATQQYTATAKDSSGNTLGGSSFTWSSSAPGVASVSSTGLATGVSAGSASISATSGGVTSAGATLTVTGPAVASITVAPSSASIAVGATQQFTATAADSGGHALTGVSFSWSSSATAVATINSSGLATGVAAGSANIIASSGGVSSGAAALAVAQPTAVNGTAAQGTALGNAAITLKDAAGVTRTSNTGADGTYTVNTTGLTAPFLVMVQPSGGNPIYSVSADGNASTVINLDPLTDLIIRAWYSAEGSSVDTAFGSPTSLAAPSPAQEAILNHLFVQVAQLWLANNGLDPSTLDLVATPFSANGAGLDKVLDETTVDIGAGTIRISDGTTTQNSTITYAPTAGTVTVTNSTTNGSNTSVSTDSTVVPVQTASARALTGITATLNGLAQTITQKGAQLAASDLSPYIASDALDGGRNATIWADSTVTDMRGKTVSIQVLTLASLDSTGTIATANVALSLGTGGSERSSLTLKNEGGGWLLYGDQRLGELDLASEMRTSLGWINDSGAEVNLDFQPPQGTVTGLTATGAGIWSATAFTRSGTVDNTYSPTPGTQQDVISDQFFLNSGPLTKLVPAGTVFTFAVTPASGVPVTYTMASNAFTTEAITMTNISDTRLGAITFGQAMSYAWTLPKTYGIAQIRLSAQVFTGDQTSSSTVSCSVQGSSLAVNATTGTITLPSTCAGQAVMQVNVELNVTGVNGELDHIIVAYK